MRTFREYLNETTLSRVWAHFEDLERTCGIISAFRNGLPHDDNVERTHQLASEISSAGFGYHFVDGRYTYDNGIEAKETSIVIYGGPDHSGKLKGLLRQWRMEYEQEAVIYKPSGTDHAIVLADSGELDIGVFHPNRVASQMSTLRGRGSRSFVFEAAFEAKNWFGRLLEDVRRRREIQQ